MKPIKWTKTDARRAELMGWCLVECTNKLGIVTGFKVCALLSSAALMTDAEARSLLLYKLTRFSEDRNGPEWKSCIKAVLLCMGGT